MALDAENPTKNMMASKVVNCFFLNLILPVSTGIVKEANLHTQSNLVEQWLLMFSN